MWKCPDCQKKEKYEAFGERWIAMKSTNDLELIFISDFIISLVHRIQKISTRCYKPLKNIYEITLR